MLKIKQVYCREDVIPYSFLVIVFLLFYLTEDFLLSLFLSTVSLAVGCLLDLVLDLLLDLFDQLECFFHNL